MDPDANLARQLEAAHKIVSLLDLRAEDRDEVSWDDFALEGMELAQAVIALDAWIRNGGFYPNRWLEAK